MTATRTSLSGRKNGTATTNKSSRCSRTYLRRCWAKYTQMP